MFWRPQQVVYCFAVQYLIFFSISNRFVEALDRNAASSFFDVTTAAPQVAFDPELSHWAENCFHECMPVCEKQNNDSDYWLELLQWSKADDCNYKCVHACLGENVAKGGKVWKFRGKWPQDRYFGLQEPASVFFSFLNLLSHVIGLIFLHGPAVAGCCHRHRFRVMAYIWILEWAASGMFHARDIGITERIDYFGGNVAMGWMLYSAIVFAFWETLQLWRKLSRYSIFIFLFSVLSLHIESGWDKIDYSTNMMLMGGLMLLHSAIWTLVCMTRPRPTNQLFFISTVLFYASAILEIQDFPPVWGLFDAHALWHAATTVPTLLFYAFLEDRLSAAAEEEAAAAAAAEGGDSAAAAAGGDASAASEGSAAEAAAAKDGQAKSTRSGKGKKAGGGHLKTS